MKIFSREKGCKNWPDTIQKQIFSRPFFLSLTVGFPFCIYKILFGILLIRAAEIFDQVLLGYLGCIVTLWAITDMFLNLIRAGFDLAGRCSGVEYCFLAQVGRYLDAADVFLALDTLITFIIICTALWSGWIAYLNPVESRVWAGATTLNLISISLVALMTEIRRRRERVLSNVHKK
jgi:hypothetical protein